MNAILQCLMHTPLVSSYFTSGLYKNHINKKKGEETLAEIISEFACEYEKANYPAKLLWKIKSAIEKFVPHFQGYDQHDAQEFLSMLIDRLNDELTITASTEGSNVSSKGSEEQSKTERTSIMGDLFCGELCSAVTCPHCGNVSARREPFYYLSVPLPQRVVVFANVGNVPGVHLCETLQRKCAASGLQSARQDHEVEACEGFAGEDIGG